MSNRCFLEGLVRVMAFQRWLGGWLGPPAGGWRLQRFVGSAEAGGAGLEAEGSRAEGWPPFRACDARMSDGLGWDEPPMEGWTMAGWGRRVLN